MMNSPSDAVGGPPAGEPSRDPSEPWDLAVIGSGPAGLSAAIYAARARIRTLVLEKMMPGGQVVLNSVIENYPGFPEGVSGFELAQRMAQQATRFGANIQTVEVTGLTVLGMASQTNVSTPSDEGTPRRPLFGVDTSTGQRIARSVLIATGSSPRKLELPGEKEYTGRGVSYCATCDGALYADKQVMVIGGGDTAMDDAIFLSNLGSKVTVVHRRDELRADRILQERALADPNIDFLWSHVPVEIVGDEVVQSVRVRQVTTKEEREVPVDGVFIAVGMVPQSGFLPAEIARDDGGYVLTDGEFRTSVVGVFAAGDVRAGSFRQIACAVGEGTQAYRNIRAYLEQGA
jgi:thioredoxin reductase (NADPH)